MLISRRLHAWTNDEACTRMNTITGKNYATLFAIKARLRAFGGSLSIPCPIRYNSVSQPVTAVIPHLCCFCDFVALLHVAMSGFHVNLLLFTVNGLFRVLYAVTPSLIKSDFLCVFFFSLPLEQHLIPCLLLFLILFLSISVNKSNVISVICYAIIVEPYHFVLPLSASVTCRLNSCYCFTRYQIVRGLVHMPGFLYLRF